MKTDMIQNFREYREQMNQRLLTHDNKVIRRIFNLDTHACLDGALTAINTEKILEISGIVNLVGGTIVIPYTRRALEYWEKLENEGNR